MVFCVLGFVLSASVDAHEEVLLLSGLERARHHDVTTLAQGMTQEDGATVLEDGRLHDFLQLVRSVVSVPLHLTKSVKSCVTRDTGTIQRRQIKD